MTDHDFHERVTACWLGKAVGGTLGMPYEGHRGELSLSFYDPVPTEMLPNDDLDLQVVYAVLLASDDQPRVDRHRLVDAWDHVGMSPDEYGVCKRNLTMGLRPPQTGSFDNWFAAGMGAAIRTELWACLAPGEPEKAAAYAYEDACMDHAGVGIDAARFLAALQSLAFVERDTERLLDSALGFIPADGELHAAIGLTRERWAATRAWRVVRAEVLAGFGHENFTHVTPNLAFTVLGLLAAVDAGGDLGAGLCTAVNCGEDTDCTGATLGALMGILDPACVTDRWLAPIGRDLVLSPSIRGVDHPATLDGFTALVEDLRQRLPASFEPPADEAAAAVPPLRAEIAGEGEDWTPVDLPGFNASRAVEAGATLRVRYRLRLAEAGPRRLVANAHAPCALRLDGEELFRRGAGEMCPAIHRPPVDQNADAELSAGEHVAELTLGPVEEAGELRWFFGVADPRPEPLCGAWLPGELAWPAARSG